jgi:hypothetical protein
MEVVAVQEKNILDTRACVIVGGNDWATFLPSLSFKTTKNGDLVSSKASLIIDKTTVIPIPAFISRMEEGKFLLKHGERFCMVEKQTLLDIGIPTGWLAAASATHA